MRSGKKTHDANKEPQPNASTYQSSNYNSISNFSFDDFLKRHYILRRLILLLIFISVIGIPIPAPLFFSFFATNSKWLPYIYKSGVFGFDTLKYCEESMGSIFQFDHEYYSEIQKALNISDAGMFDYLQQWMCVVPPDDSEGYMKSILAFNSDYSSDSKKEEVVEDEPDIDIFSNELIKQQLMNEIKEIYQPVDSEPLNIDNNK
jgi:uncharacterized membrane protein YwzB